MPSRKIPLPSGICPRTLPAVVAHDVLHAPTPRAVVREIRSRPCQAPPTVLFEVQLAHAGPPHFPALYRRRKPPWARHPPAFIFIVRGQVSRRKGGRSGLLRKRRTPVRPRCSGCRVSIPTAVGDASSVSGGFSGRRLRAWGRQLPPLRCTHLKRVRL